MDTMIAASGVWKIFGANAEQVLDTHDRSKSRDEIQEETGHVVAVKDVDFEVRRGECFVVMGLSGSGKSTLLRTLTRLIEPTGGSITIDGHDVRELSQRELRDLRRSKVAMVFQHFGLFPHRSVIDNIAYGLEVRGMGKVKRTEKAEEILDLVGLGGWGERFPRELSGGMQQRVGLARALTNDAPILLMDEAFSALDPLIRMDMQSVLLDLQKEIKKTVVFITHDLDEALRLGDRIAILRDGEVVQQGTKQEIVLKPADEYISNFVREVNRGRVITVDMVMEPVTGEAPGPKIRSGAVLETAAKRMTEQSVGHAVVVNKEGKPIGTLSIQDVISAMVTPVDHTMVDDEAA